MNKKFWIEEAAWADSFLIKIINEATISTILVSGDELFEFKLEIERYLHALNKITLSNKRNK